MAVDQLVLNPPSIGSAPCSGAGCKGAVGVPVWLWISPDVWKPVNASATAGPFTVTATATPRVTNWDLGDGTSLTCTLGTPYEVSLGWGESPDCGSRYSKVGDYQLTSTIQWDVSWTGADAGTMTTTTSSSVPIAIGEYQVVVTGH